MPSFIQSIQNIKSTWKADLLAGFLVFLLALPLSLGIAEASGFPASMGVLTAIIGGIMSLFFKVSPLTIKGPAAGLITVCSGAIFAFGGGPEAIQVCATAIVFAAIFQVIFAFLKLGSLSDFFPHAAVQGMLSTIGIIIIAKQLPVLLGVAPELYEGKSPIVLFSEMGKFVLNNNVKITIIGLVSLAILIVFPKIQIAFFKKIPSPIFILIIAIPFTLLYDFKELEPSYALVQIGDFWKEIKITWNTSFITTWVFWKYVFMFLFINSLESLLTVKAIDNISPEKKGSDYNSDLMAIGVGNFSAGILGSLPMISEVVRSSANMGFGAKSKWANLFHGLFLLLAILFLIPLIELIPNAALAAMLIFAGYQLCAPKHFIHTYKVGKEQLAIFIGTIVITLVSDLLVGIFAGIFLNFIIHLFNGAQIKYLFKVNCSVNEEENVYRIALKNSAIFSNIISFKSLLKSFKTSKNIIIDCSNAEIIDHSFVAFILSFQKNDPHDRKIDFIGKQHLKPLSNHELATRIKKAIPQKK